MSENVTKLLPRSNKANHFHQRLRLIREARGMSQSDLAKASGVGQSHIAHFESGRRKPSLDNFRALVLGLRCTADYLLLDIQHCDFEDGYRLGAFDAVEAMKNATMNMRRGIREQSN
jgi:transcriptional regulator with XRE-family HTH domain